MKETIGKHPNSAALTLEEAEAIAISGLGFIAGNETLMTRFLAITGIEARMIRVAANEPGFLAGVLEFITAHEPTVIEFAGHSGIEPQRIAMAAQRLTGGRAEWQST